MNVRNFLTNIDNRFFKENYYYLYSMSLYHILVILFSYFIPDIPKSVYYQLTFSPNAQNTILSSFDIFGFIWSIILIFLIFILDVIFLYIFITEFKPIWLSLKSIIIIETFVLGISFFIPYLRDVFLFLSVNTIIIAVTYKFIKYENIYFGSSAFKYVLILGSYIYIIKLILYAPITVIKYILYW